MYTVYTVNTVNSLNCPQKLATGRRLHRFTGFTVYTVYRFKLPTVTPPPKLALPPEIKKSIEGLKRIKNHLKLNKSIKTHDLKWCRLFKAPQTVKAPTRTRLTQTGASATLTLQVICWSRLFFTKAVFYIGFSSLGPQHSAFRYAHKLAKTMQNQLFILS